MAASRPSVSSLFSTSSKAKQTQEDLTLAQEKITQLEQALLSERDRLQATVSPSAISQASVPIASILRRPYISRRERDPKAFEELVHSIQTYGFRGAIWLQKLPDDTVRLIAGETRLDAAIASGLTEITADIVTTDDVTAVKLSRIENVRRRDLNALDDTEELLYLLTLALETDRASIIKSLYRLKNALEGKSSIDPQVQMQIEQIFEEVAPDLGITTFVSSRLPLLDLPADVLDAYNTGKLQYTKAIELGRVEPDEFRQALLKETIEQNLSLAALKAKIRPPSTKNVVDRISKLRTQFESVSEKAIRALSLEQREQLRDEVTQLEALLKRKKKEIDQITALTNPNSSEDF
jgi:ParB family transcriptional regulator, chromosome partitioning protein